MMRLRRVRLWGSLRGRGLDARLDDAYCDLLRGQRVVVVGPASGIRGSASGRRIDSYDLVVRINSQWPVADEFVDDVGRRADIVYHCCAPHCRMDPLDVREFANVKFVWYQINPKMRFLTELCARHGVPCLPFDPLRERLIQKLRTVPNTGTIAISHLLMTPLKELHVTGFSFYDTPYYDGYEAHGARRRHWRSLWRKKQPERIWKHEFQPQRRHFRSLCEADTRLTVDSELAKLMAGW